MVWMSKSDLIYFYSCPLCFKESLEEEQDLGFVFPMWVGTMTHNYHEYFWSSIFLQDGEIKLPDIPDQFTRNAMLRKNVMNLTCMEIDRWNKLKGSKNVEKLFYPTFTEKRIEVEKEELKGIVDRVEWIKDDDYRIVELKTGKSYLNKHILEISFYKYILEKKFKINITEGRVDYPTTMETKNIIFNEQIMEETKRIINMVKQKIDDEDYFISPQNLCEGHKRELKNKGII